LGLRASDIAALRLDHLNWRDGQIRVPPGKNGRERLMPMPPEVGSALVIALRARPHGVTPGALFVRARPPYRPLSAAAVTAIAQRRLRQVGVTGRCLGAHVFRHTVATRLVQRGVSMKAVADILGHARLETTAIYAKFDLDSLAAVALPWPGGTR
jgi:integrase